MRQVLLITGGVIAAIALVIGLFTFNQVNKEEAALTSRLEARSDVLTQSLAASILPAFKNNATRSIDHTNELFVGDQRPAGLAVFDSAGVIVASSENAPDVIDAALIAPVMDAAQPEGGFAKSGSETFYVFAVPIQDRESRTIGALTTIQNASYISSTIWNIWRDNLVRFLLQTVLIAVAIFALVRWVFFKPLTQLAESIRAVRRG